MGQRVDLSSSPDEREGFMSESIQSCIGEMASISKPMQRGRRLLELLEEQQEPFLLDVYLLEHGYSDRRMEDQAALMCWPDSVCRKLRSLNCYAFKRRAGIFRCLLNKVVYKVFRKALSREGALHCERWPTSFYDIGGKNNVSEFHRLLNSGAISDLHELDVELHWKEKEDPEQLSPVSVLELHHDDDSPTNSQIEEETPSTSGIVSPRETNEVSRIGLKELLHSSPTTQSSRKWDFIEPQKLLLDCIKELEEKLGISHGHSTQQRIQKTFEEEVFSWEKQRGSLGNVSQLVDFDFSKSRKAWSSFLTDKSDIGVEIENKIFEEIRNETVSSLIEFYCTLQR